MLSCERVGRAVGVPLTTEADDEGAVPGKRRGRASPSGEGSGCLYWIQPCGGSVGGDGPRERPGGGGTGERSNRASPGERRIDQKSIVAFRRAGAGNIGNMLTGISE